MLRLLIDRGNAPPRTGIGIFGQLLLQSLQAYCSDEIDAEEAGVSLPAQSFRPLRRAAYLYRLSRLRRRNYRGAEVIHFINQYVPTRNPRTSYVVSIHDLDPMMLPDAHTRRFSWYFNSIIEKSICRADVIIAPSDSVRSELLETFASAAGKIRVGGQGLSVDFIGLAEQVPKIEPDPPVLLYVGQLSKKKNIAWLIRTFRKGVRSGALPGARLILAGGRGYGFSEIERAMKEAGESVFWYPSPTLSQIVTQYRSCTAVILPSLREGFGRPLLEAMQCDKPIIASRIPTSVELAGEGAHYFAIDDPSEFYHAVVEAIEDKDPDRRRKMASERLLQYSWNNLARVYGDIYKEVAASS